MITLIALTQLVSAPLFPAHADAPADSLWLSRVKRNCRQTIMSEQPARPTRPHPLFPRLPTFSPILDGDRAEDLVEVPSKLIRNLQIMEQNKLLSKTVSVAPWSDSYWPLYLGGLGYRYNDYNFADTNWKRAKSYTLKNPASELVSKKEFDKLSPSEKYDALLGLTGRTLTASSWAEGELYFKEYGDVETWMGLCHGWSAASIMMPNPMKKVPVTTDAGEFNFYPSDIKALGTLLWAKGHPKSRFIGGRCESKNPAVDNMGRPTEPDCLDNNPGTWHMAIVNQIGQFDRSFVMDATYDYQVWNQPVLGYHYTYTNLKTGTVTPTLKEALVARSDYPDDARASVRSEDAHYLVGIQMKVTYVVENSPSTDENQPTEFRMVEYLYDLELNEQLDIVGGEWITQNHPDFLWVPIKNTFPASIGDSASTKVDLNHITASVKAAAEANAARDLPFGAVVREFFNKSAN